MSRCTIFSFRTYAEDANVLFRDDYVEKCNGSLTLGARVSVSKGSQGYSVCIGPDQDDPGVPYRVMYIAEQLVKPKTGDPEEIEAWVLHLAPEGASTAFH